MLSEDDELKKAEEKAMNSPIGRFFYKYNIIEDGIRDVV